MTAIQILVVAIAFAATMFLLVRWPKTTGLGLAASFTLVGCQQASHGDAERAMTAFASGIVIGVVVIVLALMAADFRRKAP